ncbi:Hypothetical protein R9X50_00621300 [Acrodontium crateriforme]|uniref:Uncharacterized protein n=1 Tax=Acrodontium crateriforme TaxID=150365 RepID=A0AAQ3R6M4_9PEZI|nr:Hypothetical protein R9X50_00621300 [Acrodontium crateriforme]
MASYHNTYDLRPRQSTREDTAYSPSPRNPSFLTPPAGQTSTRGQRRSDDEARSASTYRSSREKSTRYHYDPRDNYPPPLSPSLGRPEPPRLPRKRASWPPRPTCEDERASLAREAGTQVLLNTLKKDEAVSRGSIDQEPILQYSPEFKHKFEESCSSTGLTTGRKSTQGSGIPTPPSSGDERFQNVHSQTSWPNKPIHEVPELSRRTAAPYSYTKPANVPNISTSSDRFLSPGIIPPSSGNYGGRNTQLGSASAPTSPNRKTRRLDSSGKQIDDYFSAGYSRDEEAVEDTDCDTSDSTSARRQKAPKTPSKTEFDNVGINSSTTNLTASSKTSVPVRKTHLDARRMTDTANSTPNIHKLRLDQTRRPTPLMASSALSHLTSSPTSLKPDDLHLPRFREASHSSSRGMSPGSNDRTFASPSLSPKPNRESSRESASVTSPPSKNSSVTNSRPASPSPRVSGDTARLPKSDYDWNVAFSANNTRRSKPSSRLASIPAMPDMPTVDYVPSAPPMNQYPNDRPMSSGGLPYPEDDEYDTPSVAMPAEDRYFVPTPNLSAPFTYENKSRENSSASSTTRTPSIPIRSSFGAQYSATNTLPAEEKPRQSDPRPISINSETRKELLTLLKRTMPDCARPTPVSGYDDWYTVIGAPNLQFCPDCVDSVFERTVFRPSIRRSPPASLDVKVQCAFGSSAWMWFAWLLTLQQQRTELGLLKAFGDIDETTDTCPGSREAARSWYGLRDLDGLFVRDFHVCFNDVQKIECIFPTLSGIFVRLPQRPAYDQQLCSLRADGNRFPLYLDALMATHDKALTGRKAADPMPFVELVERKTRLRECSRDNMLIGGLWHTMPSLPSFTICEDCYETVVEPEMRKSNPNQIAQRIARTVQPAYGEGMGSSCQLYSPRMRRVFARSLQTNDMKYLARKADERRDAELRLQERYKDVMRRAKRLSREGSGSEDDERRLNRELERITREWQTEWE